MCACMVSGNDRVSSLADWRPPLDTVLPLFQVLDTIMRVFNNGKGSLDVASFIDAMKRKLNTVHASKFSAQG